MQELKTTLGKIKSFDPCVDGWKKLIKTVGNLDEKTEVTLLQILDSNGPEDAYWALRCWNYKEYAPLLANVAESVVYIYSEQFPDDNRVQKCIDTIRAYANGDCSKGDLDAAGAAARDAARAAARAAGAAAGAAAWDAAGAAAWAAAWDAAGAAARAAARDAARAAARAAGAAAGAAAQWKRSEQIMRDFLNNN
jgi:hypothetical protein